MKFLINGYRRYKTLDHRLSQMTSFKEVTLATLYAALVALTIIAPFVLALITLFTFTNLMILWICISFLVVLGGLFAYYWFFYYFIKKINKKVSELKTSTLLYTEFILVGSLVVIIGIIFVVIMLGVIG